MKAFYITLNIILLFGLNANGAIIYVKPGGTGLGTSWAAAYGNLQNALNAAVAGDQVWVAQGTYIPSNTGNEDTSFYLKNNVAVYGGFAGTETSLGTRADTTGKLTILSGSLGGSNHSKHVVYGVGALDLTAMLNGFTITGGVYSISGSSIFDGGAGMYNTGSPTLMNLIFLSNTLNINMTSGSVNIFAGGGGLFTKYGAPQLKGLLFKYNSVNLTGSAGGGLQIGGGGLFIDSSTVTVLNCIFDHNSVTGGTIYGGGLYVTGAGTKNVVNCLFTHNLAPNNGSGGQGGALCAGGGCIVTNSTFSGDANYTIWNTNGLVLQNSLVYGDPTSTNIHTPFGTLTINYCMVNGTYPGTGNINIALASSGYPRFADSTNYNYGLLPCSLGINAGNNAYSTTSADLAGKPRIFETIDIGAYEYQRPAVMPDTVYVNGNSTDAAPDGSSWTSAFRQLQGAIQYACPTAHPHNIWVAAGTYIPGNTGDRNATFALVYSGQKIYGGFAGGETSLNARDSTGMTNATILSGEVQGDGNPYNNCWHVVYANCDSAAELNSFTITGGCGNDPGMNLTQFSGGGILNIEGNSTFANLIIKNNQAGWGGGFANFDGSPRIKGVHFIDDTSSTGGGMYNDGDGSFSGLSWVTPYSTDRTPLLSNDSFVHCYASFGGGGFFNTDGNSIFDRATFYRNSAANYGGGMMNNNGNSTMAHVKFINNSVIDTVGGSRGGGLYLNSNDGGIVTLYDVLFTKNRSGPGGGLYAWFIGLASGVLNNVTFSENQNSTHSGIYGIGGNAIYLQSGIFKIRNTIIDSIDNGNNAISGDMTLCSIRSSLLPNSFPLIASDSGGNLLHANPMFIDTSIDDCRLQAGSPAINAGNNAFDGGITTDLASNPRINAGIIDMGAYEFYASTATINSSVDHVNIYPNPANDQLFVEHAQKGAVLRLLNMMGQQILSSTISETRQSINIRDLMPGMYILQLTDNDGERVTKTIIKQ